MLRWCSSQVARNDMFTQESDDEADLPMKLKGRTAQVHPSLDAMPSTARRSGFLDVST